MGAAPATSSGWTLVRYLQCICLYKVLDCFPLIASRKFEVPERNSELRGKPAIQPLLVSHEGERGCFDLPLRVFVSKNLSLRQWNRGSKEGEVVISRPFQERYH